MGVVLLDLMMPFKSGEEILLELSREAPEVPVVLVSGNSRISTAVECMKNGAFDYLSKPVDNDRLVSSVRRAMEVYELRLENSRIKESFLSGDADYNPAFSGIVRASKEINSLLKYTTAISKSLQPVLIEGETGVGKELFARALHNLSGRTGEFVAVNVAGIDSNRFADALFGHLKGAYTGADGARRGMVEKASGGTLFLDEIGDLDPQSQVKLLRLLQEREYSPLGSDDTITADIRVVAATNRDLPRLTSGGSFRADLYYRLRAHRVEIPPLRKRLDDVRPLLDFFLDEACLALGKKRPQYPEGLISLLKSHDYPGNVRELRMMVYDAAALNDSAVLSMKPFMRHIGGDSAEKLAVPAHDCPCSILYPEKLPSLEDANDSIIIEAMRRADGNQTLAAKLLGTSQQTISYRLKKMDPSKRGVFEPARKTG